MPFSGFGDFNPRYAEMMRKYIGANPGLSIFSGYRTPERQAQLFAASDRSGHMVARNSLHTQGLAADLRYNGARIDALPASQIEALHQSAGGFGLKFPMSWEPWHVEPYWTRGGGMAGGGALPSYVNTGSGELGDQPAQMDMARPAPQFMGGAGSDQGNFRGPFTGAMFGDRLEPSGLVDVPQFQQPPMTPERFIYGMIAGQNPLKAMVFNKLFSLFG